jgi:hypothetical protein
MKIKRFEAYEIADEHDDFAEEHAKVVVSDFVDNELDGKDLQGCFDKMALDNDLAGAGENRELHETVKEALIIYIQRMLDEAYTIR